MRPVVRCLFMFNVAACALLVGPACSMAQTTRVSSICVADSDCIVSCAWANSCCDEGCGCSNVTTTSEADAIREWQQGNCDYSDDDLCPVYSCQQVEVSNHAVCFESRCVLVVTAIDASPDPNRICVQDSDCVISCVVPGNCCNDLCECSRALNHTVVEEHEAWQAAECSAALCPEADCEAPIGPYSATCERGQCVAQQPAD